MPSQTNTVDLLVIGGDINGAGEGAPLARAALQAYLEVAPIASPTAPK